MNLFLLPREVTHRCFPFIQLINISHLAEWSHKGPSCHKSSKPCCKRFPTMQTQLMRQSLLPVSRRAELSKMEFRHDYSLLIAVGPIWKAAELQSSVRKFMLCMECFHPLGMKSVALLEHANQAGRTQVLVYICESFQWQLYNGQLCKRSSLLFWKQLRGIDVFY